MRRLSRVQWIAATLTAGVLSLPLGQTRAQPPSAEEPSSDVTKVAEDAYVYGYPLVLMDLTKQRALGGESAKVNQFSHASALATPQDRAVVRPNADTLYSTAWLDLAKGPVVLRVPATDRYYVMQMLDAYTNVFAAPGPRTTGEHNERAQDFVIVGPKYRGAVPKNMTRIEAPTDMVWIIGRVQVNGAEDLPAAVQEQLQFSLRPLRAAQPAAQKSAGATALGGRSKGPTPPQQIARMDAHAYFNKLAALLKQNPPTQAAAPELARFTSIGLVPGKPFAPTPAQEAAIDSAVPLAQERIAQSALHVAKPENGWQLVRTDIGTYGTNYERRAAVALYGLGANLAADAVYPGTQVDAQNQPLTGKKRYMLHFTKESMPPADAFWSLSLYDGQGYFVDNELHRYALGDRDKMLINSDGSLDILIQHDAPSAERQSNWLPAPEGAFSLLMRLYSPKPEVLNGQWVPPAVLPAEIAARPAASR